MLNDQTTENSRAVKETFLITVDEQTDKDMKDAAIIEIESRPSKPPPVPEHRNPPSHVLEKRNTANDLETKRNPVPDLPPKMEMEVPAKQLEENKIHTEFESLKAQLQQLNQKCFQSEREKERLLKDKENLEKRYESFCNEVSQSLKQADDRTEAAEKSQYAWQIQARGIAEELAQCKDDLFSLQHRSDVTDTQVIAEWDTLCQQITRWVDDEAEFTSNLMTRLKDLHSHSQLSPTVDKYWGANHQLTVNRFKMNDDLDCLLRYNIHCLLESWIFEENNYLFGLEKEDSKLMHALEQSLANLKPRRDQVSIDHWRSETINAILGRPNFKDGQGRSAKDVTREAENFIAPLLPRIAKGAFSRFHSQITLPAIDFASTLRRSPAHYQFIYSLNQGLHLSSRPTLTPMKKPRMVHRSELDQVDVLDIDSRKTMKPNQNLTASKEGFVAEEIMCLHPALCRRKGDGTVTVLRKPLDLVKLLSPLPRNKK